MQKEKKKNETIFSSSELQIEIPLNQKEEGNFGYLYSYQENQRKKFIEIKAYDLQTLEDDRLVNDTIINFFLK